MTRERRSSLVRMLLASDEPSIRWKVRVHVLGEDPDSRPLRRLQEQIRRSPRVRRLLNGHALQELDPYAKWQGAHWVLMALADLGYPAGDTELEPLCDRVVRYWLAERYYRDHDASGADAAQARRAVPVLNGRHRRCGSQQGGALLSIVRLGLGGDGAERLVERLLHWQWPDGGWNCDLRPEAASSSVYETLLPMRGLAAYAESRQDSETLQASHRAAEVLLERRVLYRRSTGKLIRGEWAKLHYPVYWHYDVLVALRGLAEAGCLGDDRCHDAVELLERKELPDGGWAAEGRFYRGVGDRRTHFDHVDWGGVNARRMNEWVTADALAVLKVAGRL